MMRTSPSLLAACVLLAACAPAATSGPGATPPATVADAPRAVEHAPFFSSQGKETDYRISPDNTPISQTVRGAPDQVWAALPVVYAALGIEPQVVDEAQRVVGNTRLTVSRIDGKAVSSYVRCGNEGSVIGASTRRRYRLSVLTSLRPEGSGTVVSTRVEGSASPVDGGGGVSACASNGSLEARIAELVRARTGR